MKLSHKACEAAKAKTKPYKLSDGGGMYLEVMPNGSKYWRMKYRFLGKEKRLAIGVFPIVSLNEAREARFEAKKLLHQDIDPSETKKRKKQSLLTASKNSFKAVAHAWHETQVPRWSERHAQNVMYRMERDIFPNLGNEPIANIDPPRLLRALKVIEKRGAYDVAARAKQICGQVFRYGIQTGKCTRDPSKDLQGALKTRKVKHFLALMPNAE